ncbi:MAG: phage tail assembly chaperone [Rhizobiaceae bacterium]|nr:phage tail assembly chaperone [Rhizobiaceae bacterium]
MRLQISPDEFWSLSMPELVAVFSYLNPQKSSLLHKMDRNDLLLLMTGFPDLPTPKS